MKTPGLKLIVLLVAVTLVATPGWTLAAVPGMEAPVVGEAMSQSLDRGDFQQVIRLSREAEETLTKSGRLEEAIKAISQAVVAYQALGHYRLAVTQAQKAVDIAHRIDSPANESSALASLGNAYLMVDEPAKAESTLDQALALLPSRAEPTLAATIMNTQGNMWLSRQHFDAAQVAYAKAEALAADSGEPLLHARVLANYARALILSPSPQGNGQAESFIRKGRELLDRLPPSGAKAQLLINLARLCAGTVFANRPDLRQNAKTMLQEALRICEQKQIPRTGSFAAGYLGSMAEQAKQYGPALEHTRQAIFLAQLAAAPESLFLWLWQSGRIHSATGRDEAALTSYQDSVATLQTIRQELSGDCRALNGISFQDEVVPVYQGSADLLLKRAGARVGTGLHDNVENLLQAIRTIELLKTDELQDYFQGTCVSAQKAVISRSDLTVSRTAFVYFFPLPDRLEMVVGLPDGIQKFTTAIPKDELAKEIKAFRQQLEKRTSREYLLMAQKAYDWLVRPYAGQLSAQGVDTIVFIPDGGVRTVPLSVLHDGNQFLVQRYAVAEVPALTLTDAGNERNREGADVLLAGLSQEVQNFPALDHVPEELHGISALYPATTLMDTDFKTSRLNRELDDKPYTIVHIASHGEFAANSSETYLLTWDSRLSMDQLEQFIGISRFRQKPVDLLTLSACQSAAGNDRAALGLAGLSVKAGAKSALATLWYINDQASSVLVSEFYRQLTQQGMTKAKALQNAQKALLQDELYEHPSYWAPYLLIGNWL